MLGFSLLVEEPMNITHIYSDADGQSHYENLEMKCSDQGPLGSMSEPIPVTSFIFRENPPGYEYGWHNAPREQYIVMLEGMVEITVSDGEVRTFVPGDIVLVSDTTGKGHASHSPDGKARKSLFLPI
jgi:hypothetical protein